MLIAQISDCHVEATDGPGIGGSDPGGNLALCVTQINARDPRPDAVLATGDLVNDGSPDSYAVLRRLLAPLTMPVYLIPGNHDDRSALRDAFPDHGYLPADGDFLHYVIDEHPLRLIGLDTVIPREMGGLMDATRCAWLDARLGEAPDRPTVVFMHHPPFLTGLAKMDAMGCAGGGAMGDVIARHAQVERVLCGHVHRPVQTRWNGVLTCTAPSTAAQLRLKLGPEDALEWSPEPPAYLLHFQHAEAGLLTHMAVIDGAAPPKASPIIM